MLSKGTLGRCWSTRRAPVAASSALLALFLTGQTASAAQKPRLTLGELLEASGGAFIGTVVSVDEHALESSPGFVPGRLDLSTSSALTKVTFSLNECSSARPGWHR